MCNPITFNICSIFRYRLNLPVLFIIENDLNYEICHRRHINSNFSDPHLMWYVILVYTTGVSLEECTLPIRIIKSEPFQELLEIGYDTTEPHRFPMVQFVPEILLS